MVVGDLGVLQEWSRQWLLDQPDSVRERLAGERSRRKRRR